MTAPGGPTPRTRARVAGAVLRRPALWSTALVSVGHLARPGWWHRSPPLPLPDERLWAFRMETAYGRADAEPTVEDVLDYLRWCRRGAGSGRSAGRSARMEPDRG